MKKGVFHTQLNRSKELLDKVGLFAEQAVPSYINYSRATFKNKTYLDVWKTYLEKQVYDFRLVDDSLLQFFVESFSPLRFSYSYFECPYKSMMSFDEFFTQGKIINGIVKDDYDLLREFDLLTPQLKNGVTPLRYDYSPTTYKQGCHPAAHMHFGYESTFRVTTKKILRPLSFVLFVIRQYYPNEWLIFLQQNDAATLCRNIRENLDEIDSAYFNKVDNWEMHLV